MLKNPLTTPLVDTNNFDVVQCYCIVDDFFSLLDTLRPSRKGRKSTLKVSELVTVCLIGHIYEVKCLKRLYELVRDRFNQDFTLPSYKSFVVSINVASKHMLIFVHTALDLVHTTNGDICFVDGTKLEVCKIYREGKHKTMKELATKSKSITGWYYGLKLHLLCDEHGNLIRIRFTTATVNERIPLKECIESMTNTIFVADAGYVSSQLDAYASHFSNIVLTAKRKNMKTLATIWHNKCMNARSRIESVFSELKERYGLITSLPRSVSGYLAHYVRCLFAYLVLN